MKFDILETKNVYRGFLKIKECLIRHDTHNGSEVTIKRELLEGGSAACVFVYDTNINKALLVNQFRIGAQHKKEGAWTEECIAGLIDPNEDARDTICREAMEEAGINLNKENLKLISETYPSVGISDKKLSVFIIEQDLSDIKEGDVFGTDEEEDIKLVLKDLNLLKEKAKLGKIDFLPQMVALQYLIINDKI